MVKVGVRAPASEVVDALVALAVVNPERVAITVIVDAVLALTPVMIALLLPALKVITPPIDEVEVL